jgi:hypothetical protein
MPPTSASRRDFPLWLRWAALAWLAFYIPVYWRFWGLANFLHLCDVAVVLTCIGVMANNALLVSSQAVSSLLIDFLWLLDATWRLFFGVHLIGGTEYFFDERYPLWLRLVSLFHVALVVLLIWAVRRIGYDRRGFPLQSAIVAFLFVAARFTSPIKNIDFAFTAPIFNRPLGPAPVHVALSILLMVCCVCYPTHLLLKKLFPAPSGL